MSKQFRFLTLLVVGLLLTQALGCAAGGGESDVEAESTLLAIYLEQTLTAAPPSDAETASEDALPALLPGEPPNPERTLEDSDSSLRAHEKRVLSGDNFLNNLYERPFTSIEMVYQPDVDIFTVDFAHDDAFFYFTINLNGMNVQEWGLNGIYGIEFDLSLNGRGEFFVATESPGEEWSMEQVIVMTDKNRDVGGPQPVIADAGFNGSGYDEEVTLEGDQVAFSRLNPDEEASIQIAVSRALLDYPDELLWGAWADNGLRDYGMFDYNDTMGPSKAGSPFADSEDYPVDALYSVDNTCRLPYGFEQLGAVYPGMCITAAPQKEPDEECTPYCIRRCLTHVGCCEWGCQ